MTTVVLESLQHLIRYRAVEARIVRGAIVLWLLVRLLAIVVAAYANVSGVASGSFVEVNIQTSVIVIFVVTVLSWIDARRQNVDLLLANLGTARTAMVLLPLVVASCLEAVIHALSGF